MRFRHALIAACVLLGIGWTGVALAATYYVSPTGSAANAGTQLAPWSLGKANSTLVGGDVAILLSGDYGAGTINPAVSGSSATKRITYLGSLSNPSRTLVQSVSLTDDWITVKGVQFAASIAWTGKHDSLSWCSSGSGGIGFTGGASDNVASNCTLAGSTLSFSAADTIATVARDTLQDCTFTLYMGGYGPIMRFYGCEALVMNRCRVFATVGPNGDHGTMKYYFTKYMRITDCLFDITQTHDPNASACDECGMSYVRDMSRFNRFTRDTFNLRGPYYNQIFLSASGSVTNSTFGNKWDSCLFRQDASAAGGAIYWQNGARNDTLINCVVLARGCPVFQPWNLDANCLVKNNTFVSVDFSPTENVVGGWASSTSCVNNIFYTAGSGSAGKFGDTSAASEYRGDYNLYYAAAGSAASCVVIAGVTTTAGATGKLCTTYGEDCHSIAGNPLFVGGTSVWDFNAHLRSGSPAIGAGLGGIDIGALAYGSGSPDVTPPAAVANLAIGQADVDNMLLTWTAPGGDGMSGQAAAYDLRVSTAPITSANFAAATPLTQVQTPGVAGLGQAYVATGLLPGTTYYFALKTRDSASNWSSISNVPTAATSLTDVVPPNPVTDLNASP